MSGDVLSVAAICLGLLALAQGECVRKTIAFTATLTESRKVNANQVVKYNNVITNIGNAYNSYTGVFTAPVDGVYGFHMHVLTQSGAEAWLDLFHNEEYIVSTYANEPGGYDAAGNSVMLTLNVGDRIQVKAHTSALLYGQADQQYATFTGFLIALTSN
ncbi:hypothetical protein BsWGS_04012 [Bradybaena similaris]